MGCLRKFINAIIITLAIVGFFSLGGKDLVSQWMDNWFNPPKDVMIERAKKVGDFSHINSEFEIEKAAGLMGFNAVIAEHKATGQKMIVLDSGNKKLITAEDLKSPDVEKKLLDSLKKIKYQAISIDKFEVTNRGQLNSFGKSAPYIRFEAKVKKLPIGDVGGIISVAKNSEGQDRILLSVSEKDKYSQLISDEFFKEIK